MNDVDELSSIAKRLKERGSSPDAKGVLQVAAIVKEAANEIGCSWSQSWLGYQSLVYYDNFAAPPPGAHFSIEWGLKDMGDTSGDWVEHDKETITEAVMEKAKKPDLTSLEANYIIARETFEHEKSEVISILQVELGDRKDPFIEELLNEAKNLKAFTTNEAVKMMSPKGQVMSCDTLALTQGFWVPPHLELVARMIAACSPYRAIDGLATICMKASSHLRRQESKRASSLRIGTNVFIGHGRSPAWRDLKEFVQDRLGLPYDEFNRVPVAGITNIARLSEMLEAAAVAFVVLTAEDEQVDGKLHARMNVVHEVGLFQGRLGFTKAIVLLEDTCEEFSNIQGLGQIRFPKGNISAKFEEIRRVLEREGLIQGL